MRRGPVSPVAGSAVGGVAASMALQCPLLPVLLGLAGALQGATPEVWQSPSYTIVPERGSISITCSTREPLHGVYLKQSHWPKLDNVIYYEDGKEPTVDERFRGRVTFSGSQHNLTIHMHHLQPADAGTYICQVIVQDEGWGPGTLVVVTDTCQETQPTHPALLVALAMGFFHIGLGLGALCVLMRTKIKKLCRRKDEHQVCVVYEDMSCSRRSCMSSSNPYQ